MVDFDCFEFFSGFRLGFEFENIYYLGNNIVVDNDSWRGFFIY